MDDKLVAFKEVVETFNITSRTLRYYEYIELISPHKEGRKRYYSKKELARLKLILRGKKFGFSLEEIRQWLEMYDPQSNDDQVAAWIKMSEGQIIALKARQKELDQTILELSELRDKALEHLKSRAK